MAVPLELSEFSGRELDHIGIAVVDLEAASTVYELLGFARVGDDELVTGQHVRVRAYQAGENLLELLEPTAPESPIAHFLTQRGPGLHHVAFRSVDLAADIAELVAAEARFIFTEPRPGRAGTRVVFLHPKWGQGVLIELVEHHVKETQ